MFSALLPAMSRGSTSTTTSGQASIKSCLKTSRGSSTSSITTTTTNTSFGDASLADKSVFWPDLGLGEECDCISLTVTIPSWRNANYWYQPSLRKRLSKKALKKLQRLRDILTGRAGKHHLESGPSKFTACSYAQECEYVSTSTGKNKEPCEHANNDFIAYSCAMTGLRQALAYRASALNREVSS